MGLGPYPSVTLKTARERVRQLKADIAERGLDPLIEKKRQNNIAKNSSFRSLATRLIEMKKSEWRSAKHESQWRNTLESYAFPILGEIAIADITVSEVLQILEPIWINKTETANRVRQRIESVLDYATALGLRQGDNPARWRGHLEHLLPKPQKIRTVKHLRAAPWQSMPEIYELLREESSPAAALTQLIVLTAVRSSEARGIRWAEVNLAERVWTIPRERTKANRDHRVPLTDPVLELIKDAPTSNDLIFPGPVSRKIISDVAVTKILRKAGYDFTIHGFRSTFRDWAGESTGHSWEVMESALAHRIANKTEHAYARSDLFLKRRKLMEDWAEFVTSKPKAISNLLPDMESFETQKLKRYE